MLHMAAGEPTSSELDELVELDGDAPARDVIASIEALRAATDQLAEVAVGAAPIQQVGGLIQRVEAARAVLDAASAAMISRFDAEGGATYDGLRSSSSWLQQHAQMSSSTAARRVRIARSLRHLPDLADRCRRGRLSADQADVFARNRNERTEEAMSHDESALADLAERLRPDEFARELRGWAEMVDTDGAAPEPGHRGRSFTFVQTLDDSWTGRLDLGSADGLFVDSAINSMAESLWRAEDRSDDGGRRSRSQRRADALVELVRRGCAQPSADTSAVIPTLHLIIDAGDLEGGRGADTTDGHHIDPRGTDRLICDGSVVGVVRDRHSGAVLDWGRRRRLVTRTQRAALALRDRGCSFPGCGAPPSECDAHHMHRWRDGGPSDMSNLTLACWATHHRLVHEDGWSVRPDENGMPQWLRPDGTVVGSGAGWPSHLVHPGGAPPPASSGLLDPNPGRVGGSGPAGGSHQIRTMEPVLDDDEMVRRARFRAFSLRSAA